MKTDRNPLSHVCLWACLLSSIGSTWAGNPIIPGKGVADPHVTVQGDRAYVFSGQDPELNEWRVWSSADLVNWRHESSLNPMETFRKPWPNNWPQPKRCWASFGVCKNNHWYWYFSAGTSDIGVVVADSPNGPWKDPLGKPLIARSTCGGNERDPDILIDDDGQAYLVFGTFDYYLVRLNEDMLSLAEKPRPIQLDRKFGPYGEGFTDDKPSLHKRNGLYYLSWSGFYAMASDIYGPYRYKGSFIDPDRVSTDFRPSDADLWYDRHGNFFNWHGQWYYIGHDLTRAKQFGREACISHVHFRDNGEIAPIRIDKSGVGQYDATRIIEAEDYGRAFGCEVRERPAGGFEVRNIREGNYLIYPNVMNLPQNASVNFCLVQRAPGAIEVRENGPQGRLLGTCLIPEPKIRGYPKNKYNARISCKLQNEPGTKTICLLFKGKAEETAWLDWFRFY